MNGLSPRGRGKPGKWRILMSSTRSIPAWAGETDRGSPGQRGRKVYPRVGGGNFIGILRRLGGVGLSPRGRGKRHRVALVFHRRWSIPAWAGETRQTMDWLSLEEVYPRVGGGNRAAFGIEDVSGGLSPRGRGKRFPSARESPPGRSIPAWAGETPAHSASSRSRTVYPRVGGGNSRWDQSRRGA